MSAMKRSPSELIRLADGVHMWAPDGSNTWGWANCVLFSSGGDAVLLDTPYTADLTRRLQAAAARVLPAGTEIRTVVNTHANGDHSYGNCLFPRAEVVSTAANLAHAEVEPSPPDMAALVTGSDPDSPLGWYMRQHFPHDYSGLSLRLPDRTFSGRDTLRAGELTLELIEAGPAHTQGDLIVHVPERRLVCAGDVVFLGDHPTHWAGPLANVVDACDLMLGLDPEIVVPGHGPATDQAGLRDYRDYLRYVRDRIHARHAEGWSAEDTAAELVASDHRPELGLPERQAVLTAVEYLHLEGDCRQADVLQLVQHMARLAFERHVGEGLPPGRGSWAPAEDHASA
jgi:glyoxylase-like metal-dependent hydrolase (beta-lactamase superfamily II)